LFSGLTPPAATVPVEGTVSAPGNTVHLAPATEVPAASEGLEASERHVVEGDLLPQAPLLRNHQTVPSALASLAADVTPQTILQREQRAHQQPHVPLSDQDIFNNGPSGGQYGGPNDRANGMGDRTPPQSGIAPDLTARNGNPHPPNAFEDRGQYHIADKLKEMYEMGDSPSCATCGAIMTRSGSCYRCMSCGSTSGCS
jgi:hypothetical protein